MVDARTNHDSIRSRLMHEPRGHSEMFGAILVNETELTATGEANIGVLFIHHAGYTQPCADMPPLPWTSSSSILMLKLVRISSRNET